MTPPSPSSSSNSSSTGWEQLSKTNLYIRGLPPATTDLDLIKLCQQYVSHTHTVYTPRTVMDIHTHTPTVCTQCTSTVYIQCTVMDIHTCTYSVHTMYIYSIHSMYSHGRTPTVYIQHTGMQIYKRTTTVYIQHRNNMNIQASVYIQACTHTHTLVSYTHTHTHIFIYIYIYIYIYTPHLHKYLHTPCLSLCNLDLSL